MIAEPALDAPETSDSGLLMIPQPASVAETGLELPLLADLMQKTIYFAGRPSVRQLSAQLSLSFPVIDELLAFLRQEQAVEVVGTAGVGEQSYQFALTERGRKNTGEALARNQYVGPAPVPFQLYTEVIQRQSITNIRIDSETFRSALSHLVLNEDVLTALGPAVNSGRSLLIYGGSGNGKTSITLAIGNMLPGEVLIPHSVVIHGQITKVFDPRIHQQIQEEPAADRRKETTPAYSPGKERRRDRRWVVAKRPVVSIGGELTLQDLELRYSPVSQFYIAPLQWKANSGVLIIDDFGRQMIEPQELLNRWIVPMEQRVDHLSLHTGDVVEVPFDMLLIFSSNIPPGRLGDEAFFRRIRHKVETPNPTVEEYLEILRIVCEQQSITYTEEGAQHLLTTHYEQCHRERKACHPRDLTNLICDFTQFFGAEPILAPNWLDMACDSYFVDLDDAAA